MVNPSLFASETQEWETPQDFYETLNAAHKFTLDVAATKENAKCERFFDKEKNGLMQSWAGEVCWMNPPYGRQVGKWIEKAFAESKHAKVVALLPARPDTEYFHKFIEGQSGVSYRFVKGRLKFGRRDFEVPNRAPFPSMVVIFDARTELVAKDSHSDRLENAE